MAASPFGGTSCPGLQAPTWCVPFQCLWSFRFSAFCFALIRLFRQAVVSISNYQMYRTVNAPGWKLQSTWPRKEVNMGNTWGQGLFFFFDSKRGARVLDQGNCTPDSKGSLPTACQKKVTTIVFFFLRPLIFLLMHKKAGRSTAVVEEGVCFQASRIRESQRRSFRSPLVRRWSQT